MGFINNNNNNNNNNKRKKITSCFSGHLGQHNKLFDLFKPGSYMHVYIPINNLRK